MKTAPTPISVGTSITFPLLLLTSHPRTIRSAIRGARTRSRTISAHRADTVPGAQPGSTVIPPRREAIRPSARAARLPPHSPERTSTQPAMTGFRGKSAGVVRAAVAVAAVAVVRLAPRVRTRATFRLPSRAVTCTRNPRAIPIRARCRWRGKFLNVKWKAARPSSPRRPKTSCLPMGASAAVGAVAVAGGMALAAAGP